MVDPALLDQWNEQWTCLLIGRKPAALQRVAISVAADGRLGGDHDGSVLLTYFSGHGGARFNHSKHWHVGGLLDEGQRQGGSGVACDDQQVDLLCFQEMR